MAYECILSEPLVFSIRVVVLLYFLAGVGRVVIRRVMSAECVGAAGGSAHDSDLGDRPLQLVVGGALPWDVAGVVFGGRVDPVNCAKWYDFIALLDVVSFGASDLGDNVLEYTVR